MEELNISRIAEEMKTDLQGLSQFVLEKMAGCKNEKELQETKVAFLGKKGRLTSILKKMRDLSNEEKPVMGTLVNKVRADIEQQISIKLKELKNKRFEDKIKNESCISLAG